MREYGEFSLPPFFGITYMTINRYYSGEPVNIHIQSLINIILENNWLITTKKGKDKLPLFCGNGERVNPIYATNMISNCPISVIDKSNAEKIYGPSMVSLKGKSTRSNPMLVIKYYMQIPSKIYKKNQTFSSILTSYL